MSLPATGGQEYVQRLRDNREVHLRGQRIDVTRHPAFEGILNELRRLWDLELPSPYLLPRTPDDLKKRRTSAETWAEESWGLLINTPDYMASAVVGLYEFSYQLDTYDTQFGENARNYVRYAAEQNLAVAHAIADPLVARSELYPGYTPDSDKGLQITQETPNGIVVRGVLPIVPMAPLAHELLVYSTTTRTEPERNPGVAWFAIPVSAAGLKILCGDPPSAHAQDPSHAFAHRYNEPDATVFFDDVLVPWDRLFLCYNAPLARAGLDRVRTWSLYSANIRSYYYLWTIVGVATMMAEVSGVDVQRGMRDKLGEIIIYPELFKSALVGSEFEATPTESGLLAPGDGLALAAFAEQYTRRILDVVREIAGAGLIQQVSEADLNSPDLGSYVERYFGAEAFTAAERVRLFRIAWDLLGDGGGSRKELYERWLRGDGAWTRNQLYLAYDRSDLVARISELVSRPLPV